MKPNANNQVQEIDLLELAKALWRNALIILIVGLIFGGATFGYTFFFMKPTYDASAMFYVNNSSISLGSSSVSLSGSDLNVSQNLVSTYLAILKSRTTLEEVISAASLDYTTEELKEMISTSSVSDTSIFSVNVTSGSPVESELIANTVAKVLPDRISEIVDGSSVRIVDYAIVPSARSGPSYLKNTAIGFLLGAILVCAVVVVRELLTSDDNEFIHSADELAELYPDIPVLATIPDMRETGKNGYYGKNSYYQSYNSYYGSDRTQEAGKDKKKEAK